jgi:hypothetical protein
VATPHVIQDEGNQNSTEDRDMTRSSFAGMSIILKTSAEKNISQKNSHFVTPASTN